MSVEKKPKASSVVCEGSPTVEMLVSRRSLEARFGSPLEMLATMKSDTMDFVAKVVLRLTPLVVKTNLPTKKDETVHIGARNPPSLFLESLLRFVRF
ncbi:hypothetical protein ACFX2A_002795 [Malus domestica]